MNQHYEAFRKKLQEIFMMDHAELDFGIYRIMNHKRNQINDFLDKQLLPQVEKTLQEYVKTDDSLQQELNKAIEGCKNLGIDPDTNPKVQQLRQQIAQSSTGVDDLQNTVFSRLTQFFSRYYEGGDFVSQRRYKSGGNSAYAIPYNGEEVKLYWANYDQYYIKTSENFKNYNFVVDGYNIHFCLVDATTEQNNNKETQDKKRKFMLFTENEEQYPGIHTFEVEGKDIIIRFFYDVPKDSKVKYEETNLEAIVKWINSQSDVNLKVALLRIVNPEAKADKQKTVIRKHLDDYIAKNSFDYFIHKNLGNFLLHELDFYLKNEVFVIADLDATKLQSQLAVVKAIEKVGKKIIEFLAQLENFQKRLWLKKKFVVQSDYCITLDRIPEKYYPEICANDKQRMEWVELFAIDEIQGDGLFTKGFSEPLTVDFLKQNPYLILDTKFFTSQFKHKLIAEIEELDGQTNGLLIKSENYQCLNMLMAKYKDSIGGVYYDPPYNTKKNEFVFKDSFKHSSWCSMMYDRLKLTKYLMNDTSAVLTSCDENEITDLHCVYNEIFGEDNFLSDIIWEGSSKNDQKYLSISHEYIVTALKNKQYMDSTDIRWLERKGGLDDIYKAFDAIVKKYPGNCQKQEEELKKWYKKLPNDNPAKKQKHFCNVDKRGIFFPADISKPENGYYYDVLHPVTGQPCKKPKGGWRFIETTMKEQIAEDRVIFGPDETTIPCRKSYLKETEYESASTVTYLDNRVSTALMKNLFNDKKVFSNPKYYLLIARLLKLIGQNDTTYMDMFAGSATTAHSVIHLNREDNGNRKYILGEFSEYFDKVTLRRVKKVIYSEDWKDGKPVSRKGISQCFKYIRLEQYEDTLNNLEVNDGFGKPDNESYVLRYMLDTETRDSLINTKDFVRPFDYTIKTTRDNELVDTPVDMVDTFNYLIGLHVDNIHWHKDDNICVVEGTTHIEKEHALVIWRNQDVIKNDDLNDFFRKQDYSTLDREFDVIYVNGDNTLPNLKSDEEHWKVRLIEQELMKRMFEEE